MYIKVGVVVPIRENEVGAGLPLPQFAAVLLWASRNVEGQRLMKERDLRFVDVFGSGEVSLGSVHIKE